MGSKVFKISKWLISAVAVMQLAISQIHIKVITKVFDSSIGFYLFLFILFGMVMTFNISTMKSKSKILLYLITAVAAVASGLKYIMLLFQDISTGAYLTFEQAQISVVLSIAALFVYFIFSILIVATKNRGNNGRD